MGGKSPNFFGRLRRPIKISIFCRLFVPIFNVVSTAPGDILDTIECFSVVRNTLLSLATPNREMFDMFIVNDSIFYACGVFIKNNKFLLLIISTCNISRLKVAIFLE